MSAVARALRPLDDVVVDDEVVGSERGLRCGFDLGFEKSLGKIVGHLRWG